jgi:hypothetical protein
MQDDGGGHAMAPGVRAACKLTCEQSTHNVRPQIVMAGLVPAIHVLLCGSKNVDARDKPGHDDIE